MKSLFEKSVAKVLSKKVNKGMDIVAGLENALYELDDLLHYDGTDDDEKTYRRAVREAAKIAKQVSQYAKKLTELNL